MYSGSGSQGHGSILPQRQLISWPNISGEITAGPSAVCPPTSSGCGECHHLPAAVSSFASGWNWLQCENHILRFLRCTQHHLVTIEGEAASDEERHVYHLLDHQVSAVCPTVRSFRGLCCLSIWRKWQYLSYSKMSVFSGLCC